MPILIDEWSVVPVHDYAPPEMGARLYGRVYGHPIFKDGEWATTSAVEDVRDGIVYVMSGKQYVLGNPSEDYEREFPDAKNRVLKSFDAKDEE